MIESKYEVGEVYVFFREPAQAFVAELESDDGSRLTFKWPLMVVPLDLPEGKVNMKLIPMDVIHLGPDGQVFGRGLMESFEDRLVLSNFYINPQKANFQVKAGYKNDILAFNAGFKKSAAPVNSSNIEL